VTRIAELEFDEDNEEKLAAHGISAMEVLELLANVFTLRRNKKNRSGVRKLIGQTNGGRSLTIVLAPTHTPDRWRPVTGWESTAPERRLLP
jgi:uncharacterized DUF497 family protein